MSVNHAEYYSRHGWMSNDFIEAMARRYFGDEVVDSLPRYAKGKRKGQLKGLLYWSKVAKQGWCRTGGRTDDGYATGFVELRIDKIVNVELVMPVWGKNPELIATWDWDLRHYKNRSDVMPIVHKKAVAA